MSAMMMKRTNSFNPCYYTSDNEDNHESNNNNTLDASTKEEEEVDNYNEHKAFIDLCYSDFDNDEEAKPPSPTDEQKKNKFTAEEEIREIGRDNNIDEQRDDNEEICNEREDDEEIEEEGEIGYDKNKKNQEELKKSEESGTLYYDDGEVLWIYASCMMKRRSPTPTNPPYPFYAGRMMDIPSIQEWLDMPKSVRRMWKERGYSAYNDKVEVDPQSPKCWAINQPNCVDSDDDNEASFSPTLPSYNVSEEGGANPMG
jgi:hypothetical protein